MRADSPPKKKPGLGQPKLNKWLTRPNVPGDIARTPSDFKNNKAIWPKALMGDVYAALPRHIWPFA